MRHAGISEKSTCSSSIKYFYLRYTHFKKCYANDNYDKSLEL